MEIECYVAHYSADNETETFSTFEQAKKWLEELWERDGGDDGFSEESCSGRDYIAKITHRSKFIETLNRDKDGFKWNEEANGYFKDDEEWLYETESVGEIIAEQVS